MPRATAGGAGREEVGAGRHAGAARTFGDATDVVGGA
jgi:hypothetical protein